VTCVLTDNGAQFVTPLTLQALSEAKVYTDLFSLTDENEMGHIQLVPRRRPAGGRAGDREHPGEDGGGPGDDLASTVLLATDKPVLVAPAMNVRMWLHAATQANMATLRGRGVVTIGPNEGAMACNEFGPAAWPSRRRSGGDRGALSGRKAAGRPSRDRHQRADA
jgi:phosphopantothenoylcysteine decarboxylase/phosphopantothenate--cysteine ligase